MGADVQAMVQTGPRTLELWELERPAVGDDEALIRVEACGVCGTDIGMYEAKSSHPAHQRFPIIRGHEPVGVVEEIGPRMATRLGVQAGDRVAVDPFLRCGVCRYCLSGRGELCSRVTGEHNTYATIPLSVAPGLWGGFSTHLFATSETILYPIPAHVPARYAALFNVLGAGMKWAVDAAGVSVGSSVVVLGCGQRGLACAVASLEAGAGHVTVSGLTQDSHKLALAKELGVHCVVDVEAEDLVDAVREAFPSGVDIVIDTTPGATQAVRDAITVARTGGTVVVGGLKGRPVDGFAVDELVRKEIALKGVLGTGSDHYQRAISMIANSDRRLERLQTHVLPLEQVEHGIQVLAGEVPGEHPISVVIETE